LIALGGGLLGAIFTIPLRHLLVNDLALPFPEGTATAEVVRLTDSGEPGLRHLVGGALGAATYKLLQGGAGLWPGAWNGAAWWDSWLGAGGLGGASLFMRPPGGEMAWIWGLSALAVLAYPLWRSVGSRST
jgi:uncharacterized oligopeptide transporter (OPT) family protein